MYEGTQSCKRVQRLFEWMYRQEVISDWEYGKRNFREGVQWQEVRKVANSWYICKEITCWRGKRVLFSKDPCGFWPWKVELEDIWLEDSETDSHCLFEKSEVNRGLSVHTEHLSHRALSTHGIFREASTTDAWPTLDQMIWFSALGAILILSEHHLVRRA